MSAPSPVSVEQHSLRGVLLFVFSLLLFAGMDTAIKFLAQSHPGPVIVAARYFIHALLMLTVLTPLHGRALFRTVRTRWVLVRGIALAMSSLLMGLALQRMPVGETTAIVFLSPFLVVLLAGRFLGERVGGWDWAGALLGFVGVICIARPGSGLDGWGVVFALANVSLAVVYQLLSRVLITTERTLPMLFFSAAVGALLFGALLPWTFDGQWPTMTETLMMLAIGATAALGHYLYTAAFRQAPASVLAPLGYFQMVWAIVLGWVVFDHVPDGWGLVGMALIAIVGGLSALRRPR